MTPLQINTLLNHAHAHDRAIQVGGLIALVGGFVQFFEIIRLGFRHRTHAVPMAVNLFWLANDVTYIALYSRWFHDVPDPLFRHAWFLWFPYVLMELVIAYQIINFSRQEVLGGITRSQAYLAYAALQIAVFIFYYWLNEILDDYFLMIGSMLTVIGSNMGIALLATRRSRKGQSLLLAGVLLINQGFITFFVFFPAETPQFTTSAYYVLATAVTLLGVVYFILLKRTPLYIVVYPSQIRVDD